MSSKYVENHLNLPPTTIGWFRNGRNHSITADGLIETQLGLKVLLWDGYGYLPMDKMGFYSYNLILNFELLLDPRDRFRNPERFKDNYNRHFSIHRKSYANAR